MPATERKIAKTCAAAGCGAAFWARSANTKYCDSCRKHEKCKMREVARLRRIAAGKCGKCGKMREAAQLTQGYCLACARKNNLRTRTLYQARCDAGLCYMCGDSPPSPDRAGICDDCGVHHAARQRRRRVRVRGGMPKISGTQKILRTLRAGYIVDSRDFALFGLATRGSLGRAIHRIRNFELRAERIYAVRAGYILEQQQLPHKNGGVAASPGEKSECSGREGGSPTAGIPGIRIGDDFAENKGSARLPGPGIQSERCPRRGSPYPYCRIAPHSRAFLTITEEQQ